MMMYKGVIFILSLLDQPILDYSNEFGISGHYNSHLPLLDFSWYHHTFWCFLAQYCTIYRRIFSILLSDVLFTSYMCQQYLSFISLVVRLGFQNSYRNLIEQITHFLTVHHCLLKIISLELLQPNVNEVQCYHKLY